jgi:hypothetical protein
MQQFNVDMFNSHGQSCGMIRWTTSSGHGADPTRFKLAAADRAAGNQKSHNQQGWHVKKVRRNHVPFVFVSSEGNKTERQRGERRD